MKRYYVPLLLLATAVIFSYCSGSKKASKSTSRVVYDHNVQALISQNCSPCHIPEKGGRVKALDTYAAVSGEIDDILRRIQLNPGDKGFMPMRGAKLSDSTINAFKQWKDDGMLER